MSVDIFETYRIFAPILTNKCVKERRKGKEAFRLPVVDTTDTTGKEEKTRLRFPLSGWQTFWVAPFSGRALDVYETELA